jgi:hypothetical protein
MKLIMENAALLDGSIEDELNEASGQAERNYYISGIFSTPEAKNRNGRVYSRAIWEREVERYQSEIKGKTVNTLGEWQHPPRSTVDPLKSVMRIVELKINEDGNVWGKAKILNDNTEQTNKLKGLIKEGIKIGVSSRGVGKVSATGVVENFKLITYDAVDMPSDYNAMLNGVVEGHQIVEGIVQDKEFFVDEETGCIGECSLEIPIEEKIFNGKAKIGNKTVTQMVTAKDNSEAEKKFVKMVQLQQKNGHAPKGEIKDIIFETETKGTEEVIEKTFENVDVLRNLLAEKDADKLCDLSLDEKEEVLSKFAQAVLDYDAYKKVEESKVDKVEESKLDDGIAQQLLNGLKNLGNK